MENQSTERLIAIRDIAGLDNLATYLSDPAVEYVAYDCETTGLDRDAIVVGWSVAAEPDVGYYVVTAYWDKEKRELVFMPDDFLARAKEVLQILTKKKLILHNGYVDVNWTKVNFGVDLLDAWHTDTLVLAHVTDENRASYGLKELAVERFGLTSKQEQIEMKASVLANGGVWEDKRGGNKEMYKADWEILAKYGAKDTILTLKIFYDLIPSLFEQKLDKFFYEDESMPLARTCAYQLNTTGIKVDVPKLKALAVELEKNCAKLLHEINTDIMPYVKDKYPGGSEKKSFNLNSGQQLSWLLYIRLGNDWKKVTKKGRERAKELVGRVPYNPSARRKFMEALEAAGEKPEKYIQCDKKALTNLAFRYAWVAKILEYKKEKKLLDTYAEGMQKFLRYGVIYPSFKQHGTTSGRFSSSAPNFQNLPRDDKRIKSCMIARPGKVFVGADYSQLEPRTFTSQSQDPILMDGFKKGEDFYGVIGIPVFNLWQCSANKKAENYIGSETFEGGRNKYYRQVAKVIALSLAYGTTPFKLSDELRDESGQNMSIDACTKIRDDYFEKYQGVAKFVHDSHLQIVKTGVVYNQFGRPRRIPEAKIIKTFGFPNNCSVSDLPYQYRSLCNLAVNHRVQSTAASIVNRASIAFVQRMIELGLNAKIVLQVHDELIVECDEGDAQIVSKELKDCMENTVKLDGVDLVAEPKIGKTLAELK